MWFRKSRLDPLAVTMAGVKLGDRLLVLGAQDIALIVALAGKAGLTGRTCVLDTSADVMASAARTIEREGALVEAFNAPWTMLPFDVHAFDVVVIRNILYGLDADARLRSVREAYRVLRPGGRTVAIEDRPRHGLRGFFSGSSSDPSYERSGGPAHALEAAGFRGVRTLADREGQVFVEGIKAAG